MQLAQKIFVKLMGMLLCYMYVENYDKRDNKNYKCKLYLEKNILVTDSLINYTLRITISKYPIGNEYHF